MKEKLFKEYPAVKCQKGSGAVFGYQLPHGKWVYHNLTSIQSSRLRDLIQLGLLAAKQTKRSSPKLAISCDIAEKSIAVAGDVLEACEEYYLNMTTIYGRFTMIAAINYG